MLNPSGRPPIVGDVTAFDARVVDEPWPWARENAAAIAEAWAEAKAEKPELFDGEVLIARRVEIERSRVVSTHTKIAFSELFYWRSEGFPDAGAFNLFGAAIVVTADRAVLLGRMGSHTANAGLVYFPCGTPDLDDVTGDRLDIEGSILRELIEETAIEADLLTASPQRWISWDGGLFCCARRYDTVLTARDVAALCQTHLAADPKAELDSVLLVRSVEELNGVPVPAYALSLVAAVLDG